MLTQIFTSPFVTGKFSCILAALNEVYANSFFLFVFYEKCYAVAEDCCAPEDIVVYHDAQA